MHAKRSTLIGLYLASVVQVVLKNAQNRNECATLVNSKIAEFAQRGYRALGVSTAEGGEGSPPNWTMQGLLPLFDPPRHDTKETIEECIRKGISVKMVTGDQLLIGKEVARQLGMGTNMYTTEVLLEVCSITPSTSASLPDCCCSLSRMSLSLVHKSPSLTCVPYSLSSWNSLQTHQRQLPDHAVDLCTLVHCAGVGAQCR